MGQSHPSEITKFDSAIKELNEADSNFHKRMGTFVELMENYVLSSLEANSSEYQMLNTYLEPYRLLTNNSFPHFKENGTPLQKVEAFHEAIHEDKENQFKKMEEAIILCGKNYLSFKEFLNKIIANNNSTIEKKINSQQNKDDSTPSTINKLKDKLNNSVIEPVQYSARYPLLLGAMQTEANKVNLTEDDKNKILSMIKKMRDITITYTEKMNSIATEEEKAKKSPSEFSNSTEKRMFIESVNKKESLKERINLLEAYQKGKLSKDQNQKIRKMFSKGELKEAENLITLLKENFVFYQNQIDKYVMKDIKDRAKEIQQIGQTAPLETTLPQPKSEEKSTHTSEKIIRRKYGDVIGSLERTMRSRRPMQRMAQKSSPPTTPPKINLSEEARKKQDRPPVPPKVNLSERARREQLQSNKTETPSPISPKPPGRRGSF